MCIFGVVGVSAYLGHRCRQTCSGSSASFSRPLAAFADNPEQDGRLAQQLESECTTQSTEQTRLRYGINPPAQPARSRIVDHDCQPGAPAKQPCSENYANIESAHPRLSATHTVYREWGWDEEERALCVYLQLRVREPRPRAPRARYAPRGATCARRIRACARGPRAHQKITARHAHAGYRSSEEVIG